MVESCTHEVLSPRAERLDFAPEWWFLDLEESTFYEVVGKVHKFLAVLLLDVWGNLNDKTRNACFFDVGLGKVDARTFVEEFLRDQVAVDVRTNAEPHFFNQRFPIFLYIAIYGQLRTRFIRSSSCM